MSDIICTCFDVEEHVIREAIRKHKFKDVDKVTEFIEAGGGCGACEVDIQDFLDEENA